MPSEFSPETGGNETVEAEPGRQTRPGMVARVDAMAGQSLRQIETRARENIRVEAILAQPPPHYRRDLPQAEVIRSRVSSIAVVLTVGAAGRQTVVPDLAADGDVLACPAQQSCGRRNPIRELGGRLAVPEAPDCIA